MMNGRASTSRPFEQMMLDPGGRPHPGKEHGFVAADLLTRFEQGERFRSLEFDLDPGRIFVNDFVDRWLGPRRWRRRFGDSFLAGIPRPGAGFLSHPVDRLAGSV
jgi:hypothetical protein